MTERLKDSKTPKSYLLDIEGTTTPVDFVYKTLFPFARAEMESFIRRSTHPVRQEVEYDQPPANLIKGTMLGYVGIREVLQAVANERGLHFADLERLTIDKEAVEAVPERIAKKHFVMPVKKDANTLYLAMAKPNDSAALEEVRSANGLRIIPVMAVPAEIDKAIEFHYGDRIDPALKEDLEILVKEYESESEPPPWPDRPSPEGVVHYLHWLMDQDRKSRGLKSIQGRIWEEGYRNGQLMGEVYPDVAPAMQRWKEAGASIYIYSSGSVLAQKLIFGHLPDGPLTPLIDGYFDTEVGPKRSASSYAAIASRVGVAPEDMLFLSDIAEEVSAAKEAGMSSLQVLRDSQTAGEHEFVRSFEEVR